MNIVVIFDQYYKNNKIEQLNLPCSVNVWVFKDYRDFLEDCSIKGVKMDVVVFGASNSMLLSFVLFEHIYYGTKFYLIKNIDSASSLDFINQINKSFKINILLPPFTNDNLIKLLASDNFLENKNRLAVYENKELKMLCLKDILFIKSLGDYICIVTHKRKHVVYSSLKKVESRLKNHFVKSNRSHLVNISHVTKITPSEVMLSNKFSIPLSKTQRKEILFKVKINNL